MTDRRTLLAAPRPRARLQRVPRNRGGLCSRTVAPQVGMLMTHGPNQADAFPRALVPADKVLKGAKRSDLPIEGPDRFQLVIDQAAAKALGLTISQALLLRADEVLR